MSNSLFEKMQGFLQSSQVQFGDDELSNVLAAQDASTICDISSICLGAAAELASGILKRRVLIAFPQYRLHSSADLPADTDISMMAVTIPFTQGISGKNLLLVKPDDVRLLTNLLMGGNGNFDPNEEIGELHISSVSELIGQAAAVAIETFGRLLNRHIQPAPSSSIMIGFGADALAGCADIDGLFFSIEFKVEIVGVKSSEILLVMSEELAKKIAAALKSTYSGSSDADQLQANNKAQKPQQEIQAVQYTVFDQQQENASPSPETIDVLYDVPLQVSVELGRTQRSIRDVLDFNIGSLIVLDKQSGEQVDIMVNGKTIAKGEVVVIDESYGVRITEIVTPAKRI